MDLIQQQATSKLIQLHGLDGWKQRPESERESMLQVYLFDCWHHMRNIFLKEMSAAQSKHVSHALADQLKAFSAWERMSTDFDNLIRAVYKEFHEGGRYYKVSLTYIYAMHHP